MNADSARKHPSLSERRADTRAGAVPRNTEAPARGLQPIATHFAGVLAKAKPK